MSEFSDHIHSNATESQSDVYARVHSRPISEDQARAELLVDVERRFNTIQELGGSERARVHIGAAGLFNLDILAKGQHDAAVLIDINNHQKEFWNGMIQLLADSPDIAQFKENYERNAEQYFPPHLTSTLKPLHRSSYGMFMKGTEWHKDPESYARIRQMAVDGRIVPMTIDIFDQAATSKLAAAVESSTIDGKRGIVDTVYASNIWHMCGPVFDAQQFKDFITLTVRQFGLLHDQGLNEAGIREGFASFLRVYARYEGVKDPNISPEEREATFREFADYAYSTYTRLREEHPNNERVLIDAMQTEIAQGLKTHFTISDYEIIGIGKPERPQFYDEAKESPELESILALGGNNHSGVVYLCKTYGDDPLMKMSPQTSRSGGSDLPPH